MNNQNNFDSNIDNNKKMQLNNEQTINKLEANNQQLINII